MKKILLLSVLATFLSCDIEGNDELNFSSELMSIQSVDIPEEFTFGQSHEITLNYTRPNDCYVFNRILSQPEANNTRIIAVVDNVYNNQDCNQVAEDASVSFNFNVTNTETYTFQFFQGIQNGEDQYLIVEVPVAQ